MPGIPQFTFRAVKEWGLEPEILRKEYRHFIIADGNDMIGIVSFFEHHPWKETGIVVEHMRWKPGLSTRRLFEAAYTFGMEIGSKVQMLGYVRGHDLKYFNKLKEAGVLRKVGKQSCGFDRMTTVFETPARLLSQD